MTTTLKDWQRRAAAAGWRFECPCCQNVAGPADFKAIGADPQSAAQECIGRHLPEARDAFAKGDGPCNYAAYGLLRLGEVITMPDGSEVGVMPPASSAA